jgi:ATP diphosphatase
MSNEVGRQLERLVGIMARLRAEGGCPWDREQDLRSLRPYLLEETYEVLEEMDRIAYGAPSWRPLCEELGDLLFQIVFHAQLASELGEFGMAEVARAIADKIESRHPHVFGDVKVDGAEQVLDNWAKLKAEEKRKKKGAEVSVLDGVPHAAPSLMRAERLTEKASRIGFDWPDTAGVRGKLDEELGELDQAIASGDRDALEHELGDVLFSLANLARFIKTPPEDALRQANARFIRRFARVEDGLRAQGVAFGEGTLAQMDALWNDAKKEEAQLPPPSHLPRAAPVRLTLRTPQPAAQEAFWTPLLAALGWERRPEEKADLALWAGGLEVRFVAGPGSTGSAEVSLQAPSRRAVERFHQLLAALPGAVVDLPGLDAHGGFGLRFRDPDGNLWRYELGR